MRVAVIGATGRIGRLTVAGLVAAGHDTIAVSRSCGVDVLSGDGLAAALEGAQAVIDVTNTDADDHASTIAFFTKGTSNLLAAEQQAGVGHHVLLSIVGVERVPSNAHYAGKIAQEERVTAGPVPATIVRATQFFDFPLEAASWARQGDTVTLAPLLMQPIAPQDVAHALVEAAVGTPQGRLRDLAGPQTHDLIDMARRSFAARNEEVTIVATWQGIFDTAMAGEVLLPAADARLAPTTFDDWLAAGNAGMS